MGSLRQALAAGVVLLDGGLATQLERRGYDLATPLWSARLLTDDPDAVLEVHRAYFAAGAQVATTASYQASIDALTARGDDPALVLRRSAQLATRARDEHGCGWVAGSVGPYGATLADGSEYHGEYGLSVAALRRFHRPRLQLLAGSGVDVLAIETIPCLAEVEALLRELELLDFPAWLSLTCAGERTRAGEPAAEAFAMAADCAPIFAAGANCIAPEGAERIVRLAAAVSGKPAVVYPNSGEVWDAAAHTWTGPASIDALPDARAWAAAGARLVGGCCRVGPTTIARFAAARSGLAPPPPALRTFP